MPDPGDDSNCTEFIKPGHERADARTRPNCRSGTQYYFPSNAGRSVRHGKSGAGITIEIQIEIQKIGRDTRSREKKFMIVFGLTHRMAIFIQIELLRPWQRFLLNRVR